MATVVHIVFFRFRPEISQDHKNTFASELKKLKNLSCVKDNRLLVGGPSITDPIARSQGYHYALLSYHDSRKKMEEYQASKEHHDVTSQHMWPFIDTVCRFDFEVAPEDEYMVGSVTQGFHEAPYTPEESAENSDEDNNRD